MKLVNPVTVPTSEAVKLVKLVKQTNLTSALTETGKPSDYIYTRSLGALRAPTSSWRPFGPLDFVLRALRALSPCDPPKFD